MARLPARRPPRHDLRLPRPRSLREPAAGHRFNPNKLLLDPYAKQIIGHLQWNPALFGYRMETGDDLSFDERDSAPFTFKACVIDTAFT
jgi:isoamylase